MKLTNKILVVFTYRILKLKFSKPELGGLSLFIAWPRVEYSPGKAEKNLSYFFSYDGIRDCGLRRFVHGHIHIRFIEF